MLESETDIAGQNPSFFGLNLGLISDFSLLLKTCLKPDLITPISLFIFLHVYFPCIELYSRMYCHFTNVTEQHIINWPMKTVGFTLISIRVFLGSSVRLLAHLTKVYRSRSSEFVANR